MSRTTTCPHCSTRLRVPDGITDKTLICPHCMADMDNPQPGFQIRAADIDTDVRRDMNIVSIILAVLIGLCVLGIVIALIVPAKNGDATVFLMMSSFGALDVLVSIAIVRGFIRWGASGTRGPSVGKVFGIMFLALGSIVAVVVFFFFTCLGLVMGKIKF
jgi:hypothetical protein